MLLRVLAARTEHASDIRDRVLACLELGELLESDGRRAEALTWYERAWSLDPKRTDLLARVDVLAQNEGQTAEQRLERYVAAVNRVEEPARRAELLSAIGTLEHGRGDVASAIVTWRRALEIAPAHFAVHEALLRAYGELGDSAAAMAELRRALQYFEGKERHVTLIRMSEGLAARGAHKEALALSQPLLGEDTLDESVLFALERFAEDAEDMDVARAVFERGVETARDPETRARAWERFGKFLEGWAGEVDGALRCWRAAAEEYLALPGRASDALRLLERTLDHDREGVEPAAHLLQLYLDAGEWSRVPEVYAVFLRRSEDPTPAIELLLSLESSAVVAGAATEFSELVENALWRLSDTTSPWKHPLIAARARVFASAGRREEAAEAYRILLELYADEKDARDFQVLIDSSEPGDWRRDNQRWLFAWRADSAEDTALLVEWAIAEESDFGDRQAAMAAWERASRADPASVPTWEALVRLKMDNGDIEGALDAAQVLRGLLGDEAKLATEVRIATTLIERLDRADRALPILASALERAPADLVARELGFRILKSGSPLRTRAAELLEQASSASDSPVEQIALLEQLLEITALGDTNEATLSTARKRWFDRLFGLAAGDACLGVAERAALEFSGDDGVWQRLELSSCQSGDPARAVQVYVRALARPGAVEIAEMLGRRLLAFADERTQDQKIIIDALERVLELEPGARWALDRVKLALITERRWPRLFALYERAAEAAADANERADLLDEAAIAARDVANDFDRAIDCWERVSRLRPGDARVDVALERLYEKQGQVTKLIPHLTRRVERDTGPGTRSLRERIASLWLDVSNGASALAILEPLLNEGHAGESVYRLLERLLGLGDGANEAAARRAATLLAQRYTMTGRSGDLARVLEHELALVRTPSERVERLKNLYEVRIGALADSSGALECLGELLALEPAVRSHREKLAKLADELGAHARMAEILVAAADRTEQPVAIGLLREAAAVRVERLSDAEGAADLYLRILSSVHKRAARVEAARALFGVLDKIAAPERRCNVLEQLASIETDREARRKTLLEAARIALEELVDAPRAVKNLEPLANEMPNDREARDALVRALRAAASFAELAEALRARAAASEASDARRDLVELARVLGERLSQPERAIDVWRDLRERFGRDTESFEALAGLYEAQGQWQELASLLAEEARTDRANIHLFARLGDVHRDHTGDGLAAIEAYLAAGDPEKALRALEGDEGRLVKDPALCGIVARALTRAERFADAEKLLRRHLEQEGRRRAKENGSIHLELAGILQAAGRENEAFEQLSAAAETHPSDPAILAAFARMTLDRGDLERAEKTYQSLLLVLHHSSDGKRGGSSRAEVYVELGELASRRGDADRARDFLSSALESALESEDERVGLDRALRRRAKFDALESALEAQFARATSPMIAARALATLVAFHGERGSLSETRIAQLLEHALRVRRELGSRPSSAPELEAFQKVVEAHVSLGYPEQAVELLDVMAKSADSTDEGARFELEAARLLVEVPFRRDEAAARLQAIWKGGTAPAEVALLLARVLEEEGRIDDAIAIYESLPLHHGQKRDALEAMLRLEEARGADPVRLIRALERLLQFEQGERRAEIARRLGSLYKAQGDVAALERTIALGFASDPKRRDLGDELVDLYLARGDVTQAADVLERAFEASSDASLRWRLSELHQKAGNVERALRALDFVPASRQEKAQLARRRFLVLDAAGRTEEALAELEAAYHLDSRHGTELLAAIQRTTLAASSEPWALLAADLLVRYREPAKARQILERWLEANPKCRPAQVRLAKLAENGQPSSSVSRPTPSHALFEEAKKHLANDDLVEAFDALSQAHRSDKSDTRVSFLLGLVAIDLDHVDVARGALRAFVTAAKHHQGVSDDEPSQVSTAYFHLAVIERRRGDEVAARRMASRAVEESPNNSDARRLMDEIPALASGAES
jgi:tetratricopeptide (TPR) repeat protein